MVEDSIDDLSLNGNEQTTYRKLKRLIRFCGGECDWPERRLLAHLDMKESTFTSHRRRLEAVGLILVKRRRRFGCRQNDTNIYRLSDGGFKIKPQKRTEKDLKTTTPTRENPRDEWEARRVQDREDHNRMREQYETVGRTIQAEMEQRMAAREENRRYWREGSRHRWSGGRQHRLEQAEERTRRASQASVGVYRGETTEMSEEQRQEILRRIAENEQKEREKRGYLTAGLSGEASLSVLPSTRPQPEG